MASNYLSEKASILEDRFVILENGNAYYICFYLICTSLLIAYCILRSFAFRFVLLNLIFGRLAYLSSCTICNTVNQVPTHYRKNLETEHKKKKKKEKGWQYNYISNCSYNKKQISGVQGSAAVCLYSDKSHVCYWHSLRCVGCSNCTNLGCFRLLWKDGCSRAELYKTSTMYST